MKYLTSIFALLFVLTSLKAQTRLDEVDSIYQFAIGHQGDSNALDALNNILIKIYSDNSDTAAYYADKQIEISRERGWKNYEAVGLLMKGVSLEFSGHLDSAIGYFKLGRDLAKVINDSTTQLAAHNSLARVYSLKGNYKLAMEETLEAVELVIDQDDQERNLSILNSIGQRFIELNQPDRARGFLLDALQRNRKRNDTLQIVGNCLNLGKAYFMLNLPDSSRFFYDRALNLSAITGNDYQRMRAYGGLARYYLQKELTDSAQLARDSAEAIAYRVKDVYRIHESDILQGEIYLQVGRNREAISYLEEALAWFDSANYQVVALELLKDLSLAYERAGDYETALAYLIDFQELQDDIFLKQREMARAQVNVYREQRQEKETELLNQKIRLSDQELEHQRNLRNTFFIVGILILVILLILVNRYRYERRTKRLLTRKNQIIENERERSESLLLNILPAEVANELKEKGRSDVRHIVHVDVLFSDFVGFTDLSTQLTPAQLVKEIDECFKAFDEIMTYYNLEKIKTIGDAYMAAGGLMNDAQAQAADVIKAGLEMQDFIEKRHKIKYERKEPAFRMRVGIHTGPVVAGIVGVKKFQYDIWGDTVNTASRMESSGEVGKVNISQATYELIKDTSTALGMTNQFEFKSRGKIEVKGKGEMEMLFVSLKIGKDDE